LGFRQFSGNILSDTPPKAVRSHPECERGPKPRARRVKAVMMRKLIHHVNQMPSNRLPRLIKNYTPKGKRHQGRPLKKFLDV
jgi:hypothetical protein